ncbi:hypothetical protein CONCODRAFT_79237 [Conidiobolus coronatus NRRL 28638]|uniref:Zn(2)-C6 fungal-type domain-containing protein n=1 Tax=Conidiobolus coronatus (strain ATCC 28846 / CBS 209.66 / NRRL 28638) TaxID=796925 RepID=A0A137P3Z4_CONC2|nr:hypothetical protein CONCODRAFT_79237 [Conidiobolus coronatus NRRL 28638]|eukprot:KXN69641.1 hypothetical protein CONCODRAFT_79237 [Conidiobolus coronatus NRRL 28638]
MTQPQVKERKASTKPKLPRPKISCRACDHCQKYRSRCDGNPERPCTACNTKHISCTFLTPRRKRGPKPKNLTASNGAESHINPIISTNTSHYSNDISPNSSITRSYSTGSMYNMTRVEPSSFYYTSPNIAPIPSPISNTPQPNHIPAMLTSSSSPIANRTSQYHYSHDVQSINVFMEILQPHLGIISQQELFHRMTPQIQSVYFDFLLHCITCCIQVWISPQSQHDGTYPKFNRCIEEFYKLSPPTEYDQDYSRASQLLSIIQSQLLRRFETQQAQQSQ